MPPSRPCESAPDKESFGIPLISRKGLLVHRVSAGSSVHDSCQAVIVEWLSMVEQGQRPAAPLPLHRHQMRAG